MFISAEERKQQNQEFKAIWDTGDLVLKKSVAEHICSTSTQKEAEAGGS